MVIASNGIKFLHVLYYALCLIPVAFGFFMLAGLFEKWILISKIFSSFGFILLACILACIIAAPFFRIKIVYELGKASKWIEFCGIHFLRKIVEADNFSVETGYQHVITSDLLSSYQFKKLMAYSEGNAQVLVSATESSLFKIDLIDVHKKMGSARLSVLSTGR